MLVCSHCGDLVYYDWTNVPGFGSYQVPLRSDVTERTICHVSPTGRHHAELVDA